MKLHTTGKRDLGEYIAFRSFRSFICLAEFLCDCVILSCPILLLKISAKYIVKTVEKSLNFGCKFI